MQQINKIRTMVFTCWKGQYISKWAKNALFFCGFILAIKMGFSIVDVYIEKDAPLVTRTGSDTRKRAFVDENPSIITTELFSTATPSTMTPTVNEKPKKVTHVGFLKVHKAGSTTMQNMFFRFGIKHNLTFVLPTGRNYVHRFSAVLPVSPGNHWDIFACHTEYTRKLFQSVLPNDTVRVGIIRDPFQRMLSAAYYFRDVWHNRLLMSVPKDTFVSSLIMNPEIYDPDRFSKTRNAMGWDFGFPRWVKENDTNIIATHLDMIKSDFKLIMVMERFDESLVLMKRDLNWSLSDILYLQSNAHKHTPVVMNATEEKKFRSTCFLDYAIYDKFHKIFEERVRNEWNSLKPEVDYFKSILGKVKSFCSAKDSVIKTIEIPKSFWNEPFIVTRDDCFYMKMSEMQFITKLKTRHIEMNPI